MQKTIFKISKMDCPSEENLIRMKLSDFSTIKKLDFDIANRKLTIFHTGTINDIESSLEELQLGSQKVSSKVTISPLIALSSNKNLCNSSAITCLFIDV